MRVEEVPMPGGDDKQRIRERAYELWEREGRPHGRHIDHWMQAERETGGPGAEGIARAGEGDAGLFGEEPGSSERGSRQPSGGAERGFGAAGGLGGTADNLDGMRRESGSGQADQAAIARGAGRMGAASQPARPHEPGQGVVDKPSRSRRKTGEELSESGAKRNQRRKE
jgi:hypothetical protein